MSTSYGFVSFVSYDERFKTVSQLDEPELVRVLGAVKGVVSDDLAQFGHRVDVAEHAVKQVEKTLQVVMGIACWTRTKGFE